LLSISMVAVPHLVVGRDKDALQYGAGLIINVPFPEGEVEQAVQEVVQNGLIRGTKEYNKDEFISGATAVSTSHSFPAWTEGGKVFYKQRLHTIDPRNFKDSGDVGTVTVRYVVQPQGEKSAVLRIDAIFVEDFRRVSHLSNGSIESAEYKDVHDHIEAAELMNQQTSEAEQENDRRRNPRPASGAREWSSSANSASVTAAENDSNNPTSGGVSGDSDRASGADSPDSESLEQRVARLRQQVERRVKSPGAPLKSAPFHTASTIQLLAPGTEVLIVITSPYWCGVETHEGAHGWIPLDELEPVP
jgi:hypothetical protein